MTISIDENLPSLIVEDRGEPTILETNSFGFYGMMNYTSPIHNKGLCVFTFFCEKYREGCSEKSSLCNQYEKIYMEIFKKGEVN